MNTRRNEVSTALQTIPPDNLERSLTLAQPDNLPHIGLVGDTYTITVTGEQTDGRFCVIDMHIPPDGGPPPHRVQVLVWYSASSSRPGKPPRRSEARAAQTSSAPTCRWPSDDRISP